LFNLELNGIDTDLSHIKTESYSKLGIDFFTTAIKFNHPIAYTMLRGNSSIHAFNEGDTPLAKIPVNDKNVFGLTPLNMALLYDRREIVGYLLDEGCIVNANSFHKSIANYSIPCLQELLLRYIEGNDTKWFELVPIFCRKTTTLDNFKTFVKYAMISYDEHEDEDTKTQIIIHLVSEDDTDKLERLESLKLIPHNLDINKPCSEDGATKQRFSIKDYAKTKDTANLLEALQRKSVGQSHSWIPFIQLSCMNYFAPDTS
jgi:ankyrin repeat protein